MIRQLFAVLLMIGWAGSAGAGETACRVLGTITFEVGKTVCIPGMRKDWLVCTDRSAPTGGGSWKDTGVPCREPQPHRPRDYRQVAEGPHPAPAPAEVKRVIDLFRGVVFRCVPSAGLDWTTGACKSITDEFVSEVKVARLATVVMMLAMTTRRSGGKQRRRDCHSTMQSIGKFGSRRPMMVRC